MGLYGMGIRGYVLRPDISSGFSTSLVRHAPTRFSVFGLCDSPERRRVREVDGIGGESGNIPCRYIPLLGDMGMNHLLMVPSQVSISSSSCLHPH